MKKKCFEYNTRSNLIELANCCSLIIGVSHAAGKSWYKLREQAKTLMVKLRLTG
jgi:hypothetical protein